MAGELAEEICGELGLLYCVDLSYPGRFRGDELLADARRGRLRARYSDEQFDQLAGWSRDVPGSSYLMFNNILRREDARKFQQRAGLGEKEIDR